MFSTHEIAIKDLFYQCLFLAVDQCYCNDQGRLASAHMLITITLA